MGRAVAGDGMMHIGELADRTGLSLRTLRHWDEVGLVPPSGRSEGGFRLYSPTDEQRVLLIRRMKPLGFTLDEMAELLAAMDASPDDPMAGLAADRAAYFRTQAHERRARIVRDLAAADEFLSRIGP